jgi:hypothetical protein
MKTLVTEMRTTFGGGSPTQLDSGRLPCEHGPAQESGLRYGARSAGALVVAPFVLFFGAFSVAYAWLTKARRRVMREIRAGAAAAGLAVPAAPLARGPNGLSYRWPHGQRTNLDFEVNWNRWV